MTWTIENAGKFAICTYDRLESEPKNVRLNFVEGKRYAANRQEFK